MAEDDQSSLIAALQRREQSAWSAAVDRHLREVYGFVFHLVGGDRTIAEDLNQETWLEALEGIGQCDAARGSFRNWLFGIARRRVALYYRRRFGKGDSPRPTFGRYPPEQPATNLRSVPGFAQMVTVPFSEPADTSILPADVMEQIEERFLVRAAMMALPEDRRKALIWKYVEGLSVEAIAIRMERTAKAVESLLSRAREQMRELLRGYMIPSDGRRRVCKESSHE